MGLEQYVTHYIKSRLDRMVKVYHNCKFLANIGSHGYLNERLLSLSSLGSLYMDVPLYYLAFLQTTFCVQE